MSSAEEAADVYSRSIETWAGMAGIRNGCATSFMAGVRWQHEHEHEHDATASELARLREALNTARVELGCLFTKSDLAKDRVHDSDVPEEPNSADRECIAAAFNAICAALGDSK